MRNTPTYMLVILLVLLGLGAGPLSLAAAAPPFAPAADMPGLQAGSVFDFVHGSQTRMIQLALIAVGIGIFILVRK